MMNRSKRNIQTNDKFPSDPNIHRTLNNEHTVTPNPTKTVDYLSAGNIGNVNCNCHRINNDANQGNVPQILVEDADNSAINCNKAIQHKLVANLRQACSMADLHTAVSGCSLSKSLNNVSIGNQW